MKILYAEFIESDLADIFNFISQDNLDAAYNFTEAIEQTILQLTDFPELGSYSKIKELRVKNIRVISHDKYLIFYKIAKSEINIFRIINGVRDYK